MKEYLKKIKENLLLKSIAFIGIFIVLYILLGYFHIQFRQWVYYLIGLTALIGIVLGIIQIARKKGKTIQILLATIGIAILILGTLFWQVIVVALVFSNTPEHVVEKEGKKYVAKVRSFLQVKVEYYDYINFFFMGNQVKIQEDYGKGGYDPFDEKHKNQLPQHTYDYNTSQKDIKTNKKETKQEENNKKLENTKTIEETSKILYEKEINETVKIRVIHKEAILAQRSLIGIEKTTDGGKTWEEQLQTQDQCIQIHNGAKFVFLNEKIGFINDLGLVGTNGENRELMVTIDGGKNFQKANIQLPKTIKEQSVFIEEVPYYEENTLQLKLYTIHDQSKTYYEFYSQDEGLNWKSKT